MCCWLSVLFLLSLSLFFNLPLFHRHTHTHTPPTCSLSLSLSRFPHTFPKMAAASSIQPPSVHSSLARDSALSPEMDSPESRQHEDEEATAAQPPDSGISLRDLPDLEPEEIERRLAKTRKELSNRRKILIKNLPPDTTNQVYMSVYGGEITGWSSFSLTPNILRTLARTPALSLLTFISLLSSDTRECDRGLRS